MNDFEKGFQEELYKLAQALVMGTEEELLNAPRGTGQYTEEELDLIRAINQSGRRGILGSLLGAAGGAAAGGGIGALIGGPKARGTGALIGIAAGGVPGAIGGGILGGSGDPDASRKAWDIHIRKDPEERQRVIEELGRAGTTMLTDKGRWYYL